MNILDSTRPTLILKSSERWCDYFRSNANELLPIPWDQGVRLTDRQRNAISSSVAEFQLGESSEGKTFARMAREYAERSGDAEYILAHGLFVAEEHRHARDLGRVMDLAGIPRVSKTAADGIFRRLRKLAGLEMSIAVLVTAEIIAEVYYDALMRCTDSLVLRTLCQQILRDEVKHVEFQTQRLAIMRQSRSRLPLAVTHLVHVVFMAATCNVVWLKHRRVLRGGGYGLLSFFWSIRSRMQIATRSMNPRLYGSVDLPVPVAATAPVAG